MGIEPITIQYEGNDPEGFVLSTNLHRRHLSREHRRELIAKLLQRHPDITSRKLAGELGVSHATVENVRKAISSSGSVGQINQQKTRTGTDGKKYQPHQPHRSDAINDPSKNGPHLSSPGKLGQGLGWEMRIGWPGRF